MPRTVPAAILAKQGVDGPLFFILLVELQLAGGTSNHYFSSGPAVTFNGNSYERMRVKSVDGLVGQFIDRKRRDFGSVSIVLDNLADDGSATFPITSLEGTIDLGQARVFVHCYDVDAGAGVDSIWQGYVKERTYNPDDQTVAIAASFLWDSPSTMIPTTTLQQAGFGELATSSNKESVVGDTMIPLVYGAGSFKIRPTIYAFKTQGAYVYVNGIVSGCGPTPFAAGDVAASRALLFEITPASSLDFTHRGLTPDPVPTDLTAFPDGLAHDSIAYFNAVFPITDATKDKIDNIKEDDIKLNISNGAPLISTALPSANGVLIIQNVLCDPKFGLGMSAGDFDDLTGASTIAGTRWQCRVEQHDQVPIGDWLQNVLAQIAGFMTFNGRKVQIGLKTDTESPIATFATHNSGFSGRRIHMDLVTPSFEAGDQALNQINIEYRLTNRHLRELIAYDDNAQGRAGGNIRQVEANSMTFDVLFDETQVGISGAIIIREEQNCNLLIDFDAPLPEGIDVAPGDLITVHAEQIPGSSSTFRIIAQPFAFGDEQLVHFKCQVYFPSVYNYSTTGIGIDLIRSGSDASTTGRPPDVTPVSLQVVDKVTSDVEGVEAHIRAIFTYPTVDLAGDAAAGIMHEYPIRSVQLFWRYTDESVNEWKLGKEVLYPTPQADFNVPYIKSKSIEVAFVALGLNRSHGPLGYVPDPTKKTALTADLSATAATAAVLDSTAFTVGDETQCEFELNQLTAKAAGSLTFQTSGGGSRQAQWNTVAIAHPNKTQIAVAKKNYPVLSISLTPPRFTYPAVAGFALRQRKGAVKVKIQDISAENVEDYFTYWTTNAAYASDPTMLGSATPAWYLTNPLSPPAGINWISGKAINFQIDQEDIGGAGVTMYARCAGRNGKNNYSSALSAQASNAAGDNALAIAPTPKLVVKAKGIRVKIPVPATNVNTLSKILVVLEARAGASILGYLSDTTGLGTWDSSGTEFRFDQQLQTSHLYCTKADALALWPTADAIRVRCYLVNDVGTSAVSPDATVNVSTWSLEGSATPGALAFPGSVLTNTVDGDPDKGGQARIELTFTVASGTFSSNSITRVGFTWQKRDATNTSNVGNPSSDEFEVAAAEASASSLTRTFYFKFGERVRITSVLALNGDKATATSGTLDFTAGNLLALTSTDTYTVPAPVFGTITPIDGGNKMDQVPISLSQDGVSIVWFKKLSVEISINGGAFNLEQSYNLKYLEGMYTSVSASTTINFAIKRKAGVTIQYRATAIAVGGKISTQTLSAVQGATAADRSQLTVAPATQVSNIVLRWNYAGSRLVGTWVPPAGSNDALLGYFAVFTDNAGTTFMSSVDGSASVTESVQEVEIGLVSRWKATVTKVQIDSAFSAGVKLKITPVWLVNGVRTKGTALSSSLFTFGQEHISSGGSVNQVTAGVTMTGSLNLLLNSDFDANDGVVATNLGNWLVWDGIGNPANAAHEFNITPTAANGARWNQTDHAVEISNAGAVVRLICNLKKRFKAGDKYYFSVYGRTLSGTLASGSVVVKVLKDSPSLVDNADVDINQSLNTISTTYAVISGNLRIKTTPDFNDGSGGYANQWVDVEITVPAGSTLEVDRVYLKRGEVPQAWEPRPSESDTAAPAMIPATAIASPDLVTPVTAAGGYTTGSGSSVILRPSLD